MFDRMSWYKQDCLLGIDLMDKHSDFRALLSCLRTSMGTSTCWTSPKTSTSQWANRRVTTTKRKFEDIENISNATTVDLSGEVTVSTFFIDFFIPCYSLRKQFDYKLLFSNFWSASKSPALMVWNYLYNLLVKKSNWKSWCSDFTWSMTNRQQP